MGCCNIWPCDINPQSIEAVLSRTPLGAVLTRPSGLIYSAILFFWHHSAGFPIVDWLYPRAKSRVQRITGGAVFPTCPPTKRDVSLSLPLSLPAFNFVLRVSHLSRRSKYCRISEACLPAGYWKQPSHRAVRVNCQCTGLRPVRGRPAGTTTA